MPKRIVPLSELQAKTAKPKDKDYKLVDGYGLYLLVTPSGGKLWRFNYRYKDKLKTLAFGAYPSVTLAEARRRLEEARKLLANNVDPSEIKKAQKAADTSQNQNSLEVVARTWHAGKAEGWRKATPRPRWTGWKKISSLGLGQSLSVKSSSRI